MTDKYDENTGFLDDVVAYYPPLKTGFISIPVSDTAKYGWEKPFSNPPGSVVSKEDRGDAKTQVLFQWKASSQEWKVKRGLSLQYGNIEFIQKFATDGTPLKTPLIVTFSGPANRHMLGEDNYYMNQSTGNMIYPVPDPLKTDVFMRGKVIATLPNPVIGVCIRQSPNGKKWLIVATKSGVAIEFYRVQVGQKDYEKFGTVMDTEYQGVIASVVHFSDSGAQAVAYFRVVTSIDTGYLGDPRPDSVDIYTTNRALIQISYNQDMPYSVTAVFTQTFEKEEKNRSQPGAGGCGGDGMMLEKGLSITHEIAAEFQGESLVIAKITAKFMMEDGWIQSKQNWYTRGQYSPRSGWYYLETSGYGWEGDAWECPGVPTSLKNSHPACDPWLCNKTEIFLVTGTTYDDYISYKVNLTISNGGDYTGLFALSGHYIKAYSLGCSEDTWYGYQPSSEVTLIAVFPPSEGGTSVCNNHITVYKVSCSADCSCCSFDPMPPPAPPGEENIVTYDYDPMHIVLLDLKRGNYLLQKGDASESTGTLTGIIEGTSVNVNTVFQGTGNVLEHIILDIGYGYNFFSAFGSVSGAFCGRNVWEYPELYPEDNPQIRLGYAVDGYGHVFCCASEPYDATTGISLYPVYAYLSGTDPLALNQSVGSGARFKKIGVL